MDDDKKRTQDNQATTLAKLVQSHSQLFHDADGTAYASVDQFDHSETHALRSKNFKNWAQRLFYVEHGSAINSQALNDALGALEGQAKFDSPEHKVYTRTASSGGKIYLDLANSGWQGVEVDPDGWRMVDDPPVKFRRPKAMLPLPTPARGGTIDLLRPFANVTDSDWPLVIAWLVGALRDVGPYPVLDLHGEQGTAKSTLARMLRSLVDPNSAPLRCQPRNDHDLLIAARNSWVVALDNLSNVSPQLSDSLCRLSTGGGHSARQLYTDDDEVIFQLMRPVIVNGINELCNRSDLVDRAMVVCLSRIPDHERRPESEIMAEFDQVRPEILGALLDAVSVAMANVDTVTRKDWPRMADFAKWVTAAEPAFGWQPDTFMDAYQGNRAAANELALESSPVGKALIDFMGTTDCWEGTASELLALLDDKADDRTKRLKSWPVTPKKLSEDLRRMAPNLRAAGIESKFQRTGRKRLIRLSVQECVTTVTTVTSSDSDALNGDAGDADARNGDARGTDHFPTNNRNCDAGDVGDAEPQPYLEDEIWPDGREVPWDEVLP